MKEHTDQTGQIYNQAQYTHSLVALSYRARRRGERNCRYLYIIIVLWLIKHIDNKIQVKSRHFSFVTIFGTKLLNSLHAGKIFMIFFKLVLSGHSKIDKTKVLKTNGSLMQVKSIAQYSKKLNVGLKYCRMLSWSILQYF